jgi:hypothetical protein
MRTAARLANKCSRSNGFSMHEYNEYKRFSSNSLEPFLETLSQLNGDILNGTLLDETQTKTIKVLEILIPKFYEQMNKKSREQIDYDDMIDGDDRGDAEYDALEKVITCEDSNTESDNDYTHDLELEETNSSDDEKESSIIIETSLQDSHIKNSSLQNKSKSSLELVNGESPNCAELPNSPRASCFEQFKNARRISFGEGLSEDDADCESDIGLEESVFGNMNLSRFRSERNMDILYNLFNKRSSVSSRAIDEEDSTAPNPTDIEINLNPLPELLLNKNDPIVSKFWNVENDSTSEKLNFEEDENLTKILELRRQHD